MKYKTLFDFLSRPELFKNPSNIQKNDNMHWTLNAPLLAKWIYYDLRIALSIYP